MAPALQKDGRYCIRKAPLLPEDQQEEEEAAFDETDEGDLNGCEETDMLTFIHSCFEPSLCISVMTTANQPAFGSVPYICRPNHVQMSHTGLILKYLFLM